MAYRRDQIMYCTIRRQTKTRCYKNRCRSSDVQEIFAGYVTRKTYERVEVVGCPSGVVLQAWNRTNTCTLCGGLTGRVKANDAQCLCAERGRLQSSHIELFLTPNKKILCTTCNGRGWSPKERGGRINYVLGAGGLEGALLGWGPNCKTCKGTGADSV